ncbi:MAG: hypothetical protein EA392_09465 [Cryomorphaceae bacterium]|nr:MAG: hypothetical protein EA392_09465 [Cryomorphaceae bacterium]
MKDTQQHFEELVSHTEAYVKTTVEIARLKSVRATAKTSGKAVSHLIIGVAITLFLTNLSIALALWLGHLLGAAYLGFLVVAGIYLLVVIILRIFRVQLLELPIANTVIKNLLD